MKKEVKRLFFVLFITLAICYLIQRYHLGRWYFGLYGALTWWLPSSIAQFWIEKGAADHAHKEELLRRFYCAELFKWLCMLVALGLAMHYTSAKLDLFAGYVIAALSWIGLTIF